MSIENTNLEEVKKSNLNILEAQPNIRGWIVKNGEDRVVGEVKEILFDPHQRKVHYLVVDLTNNVLELSEKEVLVPIGLAELHELNNEIILPNVSGEQLEALPEYDDNYFSPATEDRIRQVFSPEEPLASHTPRSAFYEHEHFSESKFYKRRVENSRFQ
ncbi:PRC-barrel domain-containing protein [Pedobacter sp. SYSU D00535]|uniref:PRC-barrel domain-containing protein n=1 Tax=Pedobacter sp. SYSU D00535 TaxID=2810308 RepID=UPI001A970A79|nr:PRC-barrel domain-containing protein [Pedobacter sp. SYSU D00535]